MYRVGLEDSHQKCTGFVDKMERVYNAYLEQGRRVKATSKCIQVCATTRKWPFGKSEAVFYIAPSFQEALLIMQIKCV